MACRHPRARAKILALALLAGLGTSLAKASADTPPPGARPTRGREYEAICAKGNAKFAAHDLPAAIDAYKKAIERSPHDGLGYYLLGVAQLAAGDPSGAEAAWSRASAESTGDPAVHARVLFALADSAERQKKWDEAKARWAAYRQWAVQNPRANGSVATADARAQAIDRALLQEKASDEVRQRIAETRDGGVFTDPAKAPSK